MLAAPAASGHGRGRGGKAGGARQEGARSGRGGGASASARGGGGIRILKLNPAFAAAHGLSTAAPPSAAPSSLTVSGGTGTKTGAERGEGGGGVVSANRRLKFERALNVARSTGRLNASDCALSCPLPDAIFDLRKGVEVDVSLDRDEHSVNPWDCKGEEELTLVDLSDNDLVGDGEDAHVGSGRGDKDEKDEGRRGAILDSRIERFRNVRTFRCRRCRIGSVPWTALGSLDRLTLLDLSGNCIRSVPLRFLPEAIREIDVSSNRIVTLSRWDDDDGRGGKEADEADIALPQLIRLDVSDNDLTAFPNSLRMGNLQTLRFGKNSISALPRSVIASCARTLATLDGQDNALDAPPDLGRCVSLRVVDLSRNNLRDVPKVHPSLVRLSLSNNALASVAGLFGNVAAAADGRNPPTSDPFRSQLSELCLRANKLTKMDENVMSYLTTLTFLDLGENDLRDVPSVLGFLPYLRRIILDRNPLGGAIRLSLTDDTDALKKFLRWRGPAPTGSDYLSAEHGHDGDGDGSNGPFSRVGDLEAKGVVNESLVGSHTLDLSGRGLSDFPVGILAELRSTDVSGGGGGGNEGKRPYVGDENDYDHDHDNDNHRGGGCDTIGRRVRNLKLSHNRIVALKEEWIEALPNIRRLDAGHNAIVSLPRNLGDVPLTVLELNRNRIASEALSSSALCRHGASGSTLARNLTHLNLSANALEWIPRGLFDLTLLSTLILSHNRIRSLARSKADGGDGDGDGDDDNDHQRQRQRGWHPGLPALENLDLSDNRIDDVGDLPTILAGCCPKLRSLMLNNNDICVIPPQLGLIQSLQTIDLRGNSQRSIRPAVLDRSCGAILSFLRSRMDVPEVEEAKRMQLGFAKMVGRRVVVDGEGRKEEMEGEEEEEEGGEGAFRSRGRPQGVKIPDRPRSAMPNALIGTGTSQLAKDLRREMDELTIQMNSVHLTEATKYAMKKKLAVTKAKLIKEERRLKTEAG